MNRKISPKQYATLLYEETKNSDKKEIAHKIDAFLKLLVRNNSLRLAEKIILEFEKICRKQEGITEVSIVSAKELAETTRNEIKKQFGKAELKESTDPSLIGGIIVRFGDIMIDGSIKKRLADLKNKLK